MSYADIWEGRIPDGKEQPLQEAKGTWARLFKEEEVGWYGWTRMRGKVVGSEIQEILNAVQEVV